MHLFLLLFFTIFTSAKSIEGLIYKIDPGEFVGEESLIYLASGEVLKVGPNKLNELIGLGEKKKHQIFEFTIDENRFVTRIKKTQKIELEKNFKSHFSDKLITPYVPTTLKDLETAKFYHREGRRYQKDSQCFNRAMIWSYEWWRKHQLKSMKIFIFFSRNYIRRYNFEWWFHVAPYVHVWDEGKVSEKVMDLKYTSKPLEITDWTNIFMKNDAKCFPVNSYSEYADFPYYGDCYIQRTHMYTYQPADLQMYEAWGYEKFDFNLEEVKGAYLEAFDMDFNE